MSKVLNEIFIRKFAEHIISALAADVWPLAPEYFERLVCECGLKTSYKRTNRGLIDCLGFEDGYSVKSLKFNFPNDRDPFTNFVGKNKGTRKKLHIYLARTSDDFNGKQILTGQTLPDEAGAIVTEIWNLVLTKAIAIQPTLRTLMLLYSEDYLNWCICEWIPERYNASEFSWTWNDKNNLWGVKDQVILKWQAHGRQFGVTEPITHNFLRFTIKNPPTLKAQILNIMDYEDNWVVLK